MGCLGKTWSWGKSQFNRQKHIDITGEENTSFWRGERHHFLTCLDKKGRTIKVWHEAVGVAALVVTVVLAVFTILFACSVFGGGLMYLAAGTLGLFTLASLVVTLIAFGGTAPVKEDAISDSDSDSDSSTDLHSSLD